MLVLGPPVLRPLVLRLDDVLEARVLHELLVGVGDVDRSPKVRTGMNKKVAPFEERAGFCEAGVVGADGKGVVLDLEVAAWLEIA
jgi:hypothetical protein